MANNATRLVATTDAGSYTKQFNTSGSTHYFVHGDKARCDIGYKRAVYTMIYSPPPSPPPPPLPPPSPASPPRLPPFPSPSRSSVDEMWVLAITHLDDACLNPQRQSYFKVGACFNDGAPLKNAERQSRRFNADQSLDTFASLGCTGTTSTSRANLTVVGACGGRHKVRKWGIKPKSVPSSSIQVTVAFPNTAVATQCDGEPRWDVTFSMNGDGDPMLMNQAAGGGADSDISSTCYADVRLNERVGDPQTNAYDTNSYTYECRGDKVMMYTSYPRTPAAADASSVASVRDCAQAYTFRLDNLAASFACYPATTAGISISHTSCLIFLYIILDLYPRDYQTDQPLNLES